MSFSEREAWATGMTLAQRSGERGMTVAADPNRGRDAALGALSPDNAPSKFGRDSHRRASGDREPAFHKFSMGLKSRFCRFYASRASFVFFARLPCPLKVLP